MSARRCLGTFGITAFLTTLLLVSGLAGIGSSPSPALAPHEARAITSETGATARASLTPHRPMMPMGGEARPRAPPPSPRTPSASLGTVGPTLVLLNNTAVPGNFLPVNGAGPWGMALDPSTNDLYIADGNVAEVTVLNAVTGGPVANLTVGLYPTYVLYDPANGDVYVSDYGSQNVSVINGATRTVIGSITVGVNPAGLALDSANGDLYVANYGSQNLTVVDPTTDLVVANYALPGIMPWELAYDASNRYFYITEHFFGASVAVFDTRTNTVIRSVTVGPDPMGVVVDPANGYVYVGNLLSSNITVFNGATNASVASIMLPSYLYYPGDLAIDTATSTLYVADEFPGNVSVVDIATSSITSNFAVGNGAIAPLVDTVSGDLFVSGDYSDNVSVALLTTNRVVATDRIGTAPETVVYDPTTASLFAVDQATDSVVEISPSTDRVLASIGVGEQPFGMALDPTNGYLYVADENSYNVSVVDPSTLQDIGSVSDMGCPELDTMDTQSGDLLLTDDCMGSLDVIDPSTSTVLQYASMTGTPTLGADVPQGVAYDPSNGLAYVANMFWSFYGSIYYNLTTMNPASGAVVGNVPVGAGPMGVLFDPQNGYVYVANEYSDNLSVLNTATGQIVGSIAGFNGGPFALTLNSTSGYLYVDVTTGTVDVVDTSTGTDLGSIAVGDFPTWNTWDPANGRVYVSNWNSGSISVLTLPYSAIVLASVSVSPTSLGLGTGGSGTFTATPSCTGGPCPGTVTYAWSLTNLLASSTSLTGPTFTVQAGSTPGTDYAFLNATLNGVTVKTGPFQVVISAPAPVLASVSVSPASATIFAGGSVAFVPTPTCSGGTCPSGTVYVWTATNTLGTLSSGTGTSEIFTAGTVPGLDTLFVNATLGTVTVRSGPVPVTIQAAPVTLLSVSISPATVTVPTNSSHTFNATPSCSGSCPSTLVYTWAVTSGGGSVGASTSATASYSAPATAGTAVLRVTASLNGVLRSANATITIQAPSPPALTAVTVSPGSTSIPAQGGVAAFTASPTCSGGTCPTGTTYAWTTTNSLGTLSSSTGATVSFTAGPLAGMDVLFVNATLGTVRLQSAPVVVTITAPAVTLLSIAVTPNAVTVTPGSSQTFHVASTCNTPCPSGVVYTWVLNSNRGTLNATSGTTVLFTAGSSTGTVYLQVRALLGNQLVSTVADISVSPAPASTNPATLGGLAPLDWGLIALVAIVLVAAVAFLLVRGKRRSAGGASSAPAPPPSPPPEPAPAPDSAPTGEG